MGPDRPTTVQSLRTALSRISIRLLAFNLLLVFLPVSGILGLRTYENQLLRAQESSMVQQGRLLAAALGGSDEVSAERALEVLENMEQRFDARLRVYDQHGGLLADSSALGPRLDSDGNDPDDEEPEVRQRWTYRLGLFLYRFYDRLTREDENPELAGNGADGLSHSPAEAELDAAARARQRAIDAALVGRYGRASRHSSESRALILYSGIPIRRPPFHDQEQGDVVGVALVSKSTTQILRSLWDFRISTFEVVLASLATAVLLTLLTSLTIVRPLQRLRKEAQAMLDRRGRLKSHFKGSTRRDEIGDLSRALAELTRRLDDHIRFIESFASDVSHEFKNPLAAIRNATELLSEVEEPEQRQRFIAMAQKDIARLERLLSGVREITRVDSGLEGESAVPLELGGLLRGLVERCEMRPGRRAPVRFESDGPVRVTAHPDRLAQVFENLLANALSFSPPDEPIDVRLETHGDETRILVRDHGPGFPEEHLDRIFDRFFTYRPDSPATGNGSRREDHTGLGLAIAKAIVEGHGGTLKAANAEGGGALLTVTLPRLSG